MEAYLARAQAQAQARSREDAGHCNIGLIHADHLQALRQPDRLPAGPSTAHQQPDAAGRAGRRHHRQIIAPFKLPMKMVHLVLINGSLRGARGPRHAHAGRRRRAGDLAADRGRLMFPRDVAGQFSREHGCTPAEWQRDLPGAVAATDGPAWRRGSGHGASARRWLADLRWQVLPPRQIALVRLPRLQVDFRFEQVDAGTRSAFMRHFDLYTPARRAWTSSSHRSPRAHAASFHACLDVVAREQRYLAQLQAPPLQKVRDFVRQNVADDVSQFVALHGTGSSAGPTSSRPGRRRVAHTGRLGMGVLPAWRGQGLGRRLLQACIDKAQARGITRVELEARADNARAIALYERLGFRHEAVKRKALRFDGCYFDAAQMVLLLGDAA
jgi:ribosomal protein S18 acetylase RimI-like enzyme